MTNVLGLDGSSADKPLCIIPKFPPEILSLSTQQIPLYRLSFKCQALRKLLIPLGIFRNLVYNLLVVHRIQVSLWQNHQRLESLMEY